MASLDEIDEPISLQSLRTVLSQLGSGGGEISPSVYETAQVLRYWPCDRTIGEIVDWLLEQQESDGGWGDPEAPLYRDVPTLAAVLALHERGHCRPAQNAVHAGLHYLERSANYWRPPLPAEIPVGFELTLSSMLDDSQSAGLLRSRKPYIAIDELGTRRRRLIEKLSPGAGSPATFSWEAWGTDPTVDLVDNVGSVGHSPAATARWLQLAARTNGHGQACIRAETYLLRASAVAKPAVPGIVPGPWPLKRFEQAFGLYVLLVADLFKEESLRTVVGAQMDSLKTALRPDGIGFSDHFASDGDDTAAAVALLAAMEFPDAMLLLDAYKRPGHFSTYPFELHPSLTVTARAVHALALTGQSRDEWLPTIYAAQHADGIWYGDKWNISPWYSTYVALAALQGITSCPARERALTAILSRQQDDGGWSVGSRTTPIDTAFALLALHVLASDLVLPNVARHAIIQGRGYLQSKLQQPSLKRALRWISKDLFSPPRIDNVYVLSALLANTEAVALRRDLRGKVYR